MARIAPACVPLSVKAVKNASPVLVGACSRLSEFAPACSPEAEKPWIRRRTTSSAGAHRPIESYVGRQPTRKVATPIIVTVSSSTRLRP